MSYTALQIDGLKELINIGGGHAGTSLSKLLQQPIDMRVPEVEILAYEDLYQQIMAEDKEVHVVISQIEGAFRGIFLFVLTDESAAKLRQLMIQESDPSEELKQSVINELTNILTNSFLIAIGQLLETQLSASLPSASYDFFGAAISSIYLAMAQYDEQVMVIRNEFVYAKETLEASLFLIPEIGVLENIFDSLGI